MIPMTLGEVAAAVEGRLYDADPETMVTGSVEFDSRRVQPGGLFLALPGERVDGHDFAARAVESGVVAVLATRPVPGPRIEVAEGLVALGRLARALLDRLPSLTVIGVTGSSGKTSTKDLIAQVLARRGATVAPPGSFNNELGHPYTVLQAEAGTAFLVLEKSARGLGHITWLTQVAPPQIGVVLNVGKAHVGEFGSVEVTTQAKGELVEALPRYDEGGVAILNADDPRVRSMATRTQARVVLVGQSPEAQVRAEEVSLDPVGRPHFLLVAPAGSARVQLPLVGEHHLGNALAAAAVGLETGMTVAEVAEALTAARAISPRRMQVTERADGVTIIDDSYNANPDSMRAALKALKAVAGPRRTWAVLSYMGELGEHAEAEHDAVGRLAVRLGVDRLVVVGNEAAAIHAGAVLEGSWGEESVHVSDVDAAIRVVHAELEPGDVVLVKASNAAHLERVARALTESAEARA
jgi:UDP-N-acetylmuramoyl-tripeptide--D-alanyl-D-alanine ligase